MCQFGEFDPSPLQDLICLLPAPERYKKHDDKYDFDFYNGLGEAVKAVWPGFAEAADDCPACMLAAVRQAGIPVSALSDFFSYREAVADIFAIHNDAEREACQRG